MNGSPAFNSYVSARSRARATKALLIAGAIVSAISMVASALELAFPTLNPEDEIENNPGGLVIALLIFGLGILQLLIYLATVICFLMWLHRAYTNVAGFPTFPGTMSYSASWAVGSFFIPFVNLVVPYRAVKEVWDNSAPNVYMSSPSTPAWFPLWWAFWLLSNLAGNIYFRLSIREDVSRETIAIAGVLDGALSVAAAIFAMVVVEEITRRQEETSASLKLGQHPSHPPPPPTFGGSQVPEIS
jgi:Domain of unknown function (DUF4328)